MAKNANKRYIYTSKVPEKTYTTAFVKAIPLKYGAAKGFMKFKGRLILVCEKAVLELKEKK